MEKGLIIKKFLFILYLIISSNMISVKSKIEYSKNFDNFLNGIQVPDTGNLLFLDDPIEDGNQNPQQGSKAIQKLLNFIVGMMAMIPGYRDKGILFASLIDLNDKPECTHQAFQQKFQSVRVSQELIQMARVQETDKLIEDIINDLGHSEEVRSIDWSNPREACKNVLKLQKEKYSDIKKHLEHTEKLSEFALKVYHNNETFAEFYSKIGTGLTTLFHKDRIKLKDFILKLNFNGDNEKMMITYRDYKKWREDLVQLIDILIESENAARQIEEDLLDLKEHLPDCSILPISNELPHEVTNFISTFIGGILVMKQVAICLGIHTMIFVTVLSFGITQLVKIVALLFGLIFARILQFAVLIAQVGYYLYKGKATDENSYLKQKYRYYGHAAGALFNMILAIIGLN
jgi:hypothetical protein